MPHPKRGYFLRDGTPIPSVTTVIKRFQDSAGLIIWANRQGLAGKDTRDVVGAAATAGTVCHSMIECRLLGQRLPSFEDTDPELVRLARTGYENFLSWKRSAGVTVDATEMAIISETMRFAGTLDAGGRGLVNGKRALVDWKTSNKVHAEYIVQCGGYSLLWNEKFPDDQIQEIHLLRVGKKHAEFEHRVWGKDVVALAMKQFLLWRESYELDRELRGLA